MSQPNTNIALVQKSIHTMKSFMSDTIDPNAAAAFIKDWPNHLITDIILSEIYHDSTIDQQDKKVVNEYKAVIGQVTKVLKTELNFKPFFDIVKSYETCAGAYIQEETNKKGEIVKEPDYELQKSLDKYRQK